MGPKSTGAVSGNVPVTTRTQQGTAPVTTPAVAGEPYKVRVNDTLAKLALQAYGDASKWKLIRDDPANAGKVKMKGDLPVIQIGAELKIPPAPEGWAMRNAPRREVAGPPPPPPVASGPLDTGKAFANALKTFNALETQMQGLSAPLREQLFSALEKGGPVPEQFKAVVQAAAQAQTELQGQIAQLPADQAGNMTKLLTGESAHWPLSDRLVQQLTGSKIDQTSVTVSPDVEKALEAMGTHANAAEMGAFLDAVVKSGTSVEQFIDQMLAGKGPLGDKFSVAGEEGKHAITRVAIDELTKRMKVPSGGGQAEQDAHNARIGGLIELFRNPNMSNQPPEESIAQAQAAAQQVNAGQLLQGAKQATGNDNVLSQAELQAMPDGVLKQAAMALAQANPQQPITSELLMQKAAELTMGGAAAVPQQVQAAALLQGAKQATGSDNILSPAEFGAMPDGVLKQAAIALAQAGPTPISSEALAQKAAELMAGGAPAQPQVDTAQLLQGAKQATGNDNMLSPAELQAMPDGVLKQAAMALAQANPRQPISSEMMAQKAAELMAGGGPNQQQSIQQQAAAAAQQAMYAAQSGRAAIGNGVGFNPYLNYAQASDGALIQQMASAPLFSPEEMEGMKNLPPEQRAMMELQARKQREALLTSILTNIMNMKHEQLKQISQNLRG